MHAGGRAVIDGLGKQLRLPDEKLAPSTNALHFYGEADTPVVPPCFNRLPSENPCAE